MREPMSNQDRRVVEGFGEEWERFTQAELSAHDRGKIFADYFAIFPWGALPKGGGVGVDFGCGSGRWALLVSPRVSQLHCVDASEQVLRVARKNLQGVENVRFHHCGVDTLPFPDSSLDFAYSLGVLHHVPDTAAAIRSLTAKLKPGAPLLIYLYYAFDNRPLWFRFVWRLSDIGRRVVSRTPFVLRYWVSQTLAAVVYWPLASAARWLDRRDKLPPSWPLGYYRDKSFYVMRTDALDRFGTRLERRFTRPQIREMLDAAGLSDIRFSDKPPFWCALAIKK